MRCKATRISFAAKLMFATIHNKNALVGGECLLLANATNKYTPSTLVIPAKSHHLLKSMKAQ